MNLSVDTHLLISLAARTSLLLMIGLLALRLARRYSPGLRYELAVAAVVTALVLPAGHLLIPSLDILPLQTLTGQESFSYMMGSETAASLPDGEVDPENPSTFAPPPDPRPAVPSGNGNVMIEAVSSVVGSFRSLSLGQMAAILWLVGALVMAGRMLVARLALARLWRSASPPRDEDWSDVLEEAGDRVFLTREVKTRELAGIRSPMTWGIFQPKLLLPSEAKDWSRDRKLNAVMHEMVHVRRMDALHDVMSAVLLVVHWFNPLVWMVRSELKAGREASCDREVLQLGAEPEEYARMLIDVAKEMRSYRGAPRMAMTIARPSQLEGRVLSVLNYKGEGLASTNRWMITGCSVFLLLFISAAAPAGPADVAEDDPLTSTAAAEITNAGENEKASSWDPASDDSAPVVEQEDNSGKGARSAETHSGDERSMIPTPHDPEVDDSSQNIGDDPGWEITLDENAEEAIGDLFAVAGIKLADAVLQELGHSMEDLDWKELLRDVDWKAEGNGWSVDGSETRDAFDEVPNGDIVDVMAHFSNGIQNAVIVELERIVSEEPGTTKARRARKALIEIDSEASRDALKRLGLLPIGN